MLAFTLVIFLFTFWLILGLAVLSLLGDRQDSSLQALLLAPVIGVASTVLPVFTLNRLGLPIERFGMGLAIGLLIAAIGVLWRTKLKLNWREYLPFVGIFLLTLCVIGWPFLQYDFDWASFGNGDMTLYYIQSAQRFLHHGFFEPPGIEYASGRDYSFDTWPLQQKGHRVGAELLQGWVCSLTGLDPLRVAMPLLVVLQMVLVSAAGALVCYGKYARSAAFFTSLLYSVSALGSLGVVQQLLSQILGIGLLIGCTILLLRSFSHLKGRVGVQFSLLLGLLIAALFIAYQEVFPFLVAVFGLYVAIGLIRKHLILKPIVPIVVMSSVTALLLLRGYFIGFLQYTVLAKEYALKAAEFNRLIFPHFFVPTGLGTFWGLTNFSTIPSEPWLSISIVVGGLLLLGITVAAVWQAWSGQAVGMMTVIMLVLGSLLLLRTSDYGLNKLSMFIQPFLLGSFVVAVFTLLHHPIARLIPVLALALLNFHTQQSYVHTSVDASYGFVELPKATHTRLYSELEALINSTPSQHLVVDTANTSMSGVISTFTRGKAATFISESAFVSWIGSLVDLGLTAINGRFDLHDRQDPTAADEFVFNLERLDVSKFLMAQKDAMLLSMEPQQGLFNRWHNDLNSQSNFSLRPLEQVTNHLAFTRSKLGPHYFSRIEERFRAAFYNLEQDIAFKTQSASALGRHILFRVVHPSEQPRLVLNISTTYLKDKSNELPPAAAIGTERHSFPIVGRGSARVFSPPLQPQQIEGFPYVGIDMGRSGKLFEIARPGLMQLYGTQIALDPREIVAFGRDISLISEQEYETLAAPTQLQNFPDDLANKNLEYSGLYEDGWISEAAFFSLNHPANAPTLRIQGMVPSIQDQAFTTELTIAVNGKNVKTQLLNVGEFDIQLPVQPSPQRQRIDLRFSQVQTLSGSDSRPAAAKLSFIGFVEQDDKTLVAPTQLQNFPDDLANKNLEYSGLYKDGWLSEAAFFSLNHPANAPTLRIQGMVPSIQDQAFTTELTIAVNGKDIKTQLLKLGEFDIQLPVQPSPQRPRIDLRFSQVQTLPGSDGRRVAAKLNFIGFVK